MPKSKPAPKPFLTVQAVQCIRCGDVIFSRAQYDYHSCSCGETFIDGGRDYVRVGWKNLHPIGISLVLTQSNQVLYNDWNKRTDKFGTMKCSIELQKDKTYRRNKGGSFILCSAP